MKALWLLLVIACSYGDPTAGAIFKCDDTHACPSGQGCVNGLCGGAAGTAGVACGSGDTCGSGEQCCVDFVSAPHCIATTAACAGFGASCDGPADCTAPSQCCGGMGSAACGSASCSPHACAVPDDCGSDETCCMVTMLPWGFCSVACSAGPP